MKLNLNMGIARTHRIATQFVGMQLSGANLLALAVSAGSVVAGTVTLAVQKYPGSWPLWLAAGVIGIGLALLIEGLTLSSLIRIRLANRAIHAMEERLDREQQEQLARLALPDPTQPDYRQTMRQYRATARILQAEARRKRRRATRQERKQRRFSLPFAAMGAIASAAAGGLFYHTILAGLGPLESLGLAVLFPLVVTGTFINSEIHKDAQEDAIKEGFGGGALTETAIREETKLQSALAVHQKVLSYLDKPEAEQDIEAGARSLVRDILRELRESSLHTGQQTGHVTVSQEQRAGPDRESADQAKRLLPERTGQAGTTGQPAWSDPAAFSKAVTPFPTTEHGEHNLTVFQATTGQQAGQDNKPTGQRQAEATPHQEQDRTGQTIATTRGQDTGKIRPFVKDVSAKTGQSEPDTTTARLLSYQAEHPGATQVEIAQALGVSVKTIQRRLAARRGQRTA